MRRTIAVAFLLCAGCASSGSDVGDRSFWDIRPFFTRTCDPDTLKPPRPTACVPYTPPGTAGSTAATPPAPPSGS
jgi:hypothetical protein